MLVIAAAIAASIQRPPRQTATAVVQSTATVRILAGVRLHLGERHSGDGFVARDSVLRTAGVSLTAKLIEFE